MAVAGITPSHAAETNDTFTEVTFDELIDLEAEHHAVDTEIIRQHWKLSMPLFARRKAFIPKIPMFWALVFDEAPPEIENNIQPTDSQFFADYLLDFEVDRFELDTEPRSFKISFEFKENPHFEDRIIEKTFWWRHAQEGWTGHVSEPVTITWKTGKDLTRGLTDATVALWTRWKEMDGEAQRLGFSIMEEEKTYTELKKKLEDSDFSMHSFFTLFTFVSTHRWVSAEENEETLNRDKMDREARQSGKEVPDRKEEADAAIDDTHVLACPQGDDIATVLVEELYANAIKYFTAAHEHDSATQSERDFEEELGDEFDSDDESGNDDEASSPAPRKRALSDGDELSEPTPKSSRKK
ncbi:hypothetical protein BT63DRAFT_410101 [Microthyrium microscopicum]|uniref:Uncharacterized protein n=1 Tax=Microthyrium microscopicum TaxID=703497 RepID=A0A6A6UPM6_9PEZI|nr:hypothetical protein BT63DRAFT_410101 [Microthyrium microscopicum]